MYYFSTSQFRENEKPRKEIALKPLPKIPPKEIALNGRAAKGNNAKLENCCFVLKKS